MDQEQCSYDRLEVYSKTSEGQYDNHGAFCGTRAPPSITSKGNVLRVLFASDASVQQTGFAAVFYTGEEYLKLGSKSFLFFATIIMLHPEI